MQTNEKNNSKQPKTPTAAQLGQISDLVVDLHDSYDNGLREMQEAIHYAVGVLAVIEDDHEAIVADEKKTNVFYLIDLANHLRKMESILPPKTTRYE